MLLLVYETLAERSTHVCSKPTVKYAKRPYHLLLYLYGTYIDRVDTEPSPHAFSQLSGSVMEPFQLSVRRREPQRPDHLFD